MILQMPLHDDEVVVFFRLPAAIWADRIALVGDFNHWDAGATPMHQGEQYWEARLVLPAGACYSYAYLLDGVDWRTEPASQVRANQGVTAPVTLLPVSIPQIQQAMIGR